MAPADHWETLWRTILDDIAPGTASKLRIKPIVHAAYERDEPLPRNHEAKAFREAANWFTRSGLLVSPSESGAVRQALLGGSESAEPAPPTFVPGDGTSGIMEGYASGIRHDGSQLRRLPLRADCNLESAMVLALDGQARKDFRTTAVASNLLDFVYYTSGMCRGARADPGHGAYGLIGWGDVAPAWLVATPGPCSRPLLQLQP